jgi:oxygen-independent coproporphyrinogen-3 oxidase
MELHWRKDGSLPPVYRWGKLDLPEWGPMARTMIWKYGETRLPRYTSYPTVPLFSPAPTSNGCGPCPQSKAPRFISTSPSAAQCAGIAVATRRSPRGDQSILDYLDVLQKEIRHVAETRQDPLAIGEIHFGGGTRRS